MPRPQKLKTVCCATEFYYGHPKKHKETIQITMEQFETIRLIDYENLNQDEASKLMNVARTTVQALYDQARTLIATALIESKGIQVGGGHYELCDEDAHKDRKGCMKGYGQGEGHGHGDGHCHEDGEGHEHGHGHKDGHGHGDGHGHKDGHGKGHCHDHEHEEEKESDKA
ncbi:DUF134 domain-containing protein [Mariniplasma anaerobium]|uniref:Uncharacterized protein n=1 Tax=Mariniplasma anaerobium TaxID=2735436 RepID=A0A7U9XUG3_9MOLU|nr:DUF134 domain-containing protein [Mariniplasma anaerobium]BCR35691.1 hypothetical protein MPAN_005840 [Mariniplasma anaerobium]